MAEKVRLRRKDIKRPDEFITLTGQALAWGREHQQLVIWAAAGLIAGDPRRIIWKAKDATAVAVPAPATSEAVPEAA